MRKKLTTKTVEALSNNGPKRIEIWDIALPGFGIRVSPGGSKTWFCAARQSGRPKRFTLGPFPRLSLCEAREAARKAMSDARNWTSELVAAEPIMTLGEAKELFIEIYAKPKNRNWRGTERLLDLKFQSLFNEPLRNIIRPQIVRILDDMVALGRIGSANHALSAIKKLMNWALNRGMIDVNPIAGMSSPGKKVSRDRTLQDREIELLLSATDAAGYPFGTIYRLLLYTGQRRGEVSGMRWSEIDLDSASWKIPAIRSKNGCAHEVPLAPAVLDILRCIPRFQGSDYVFTTTGITPVSGFGRAKYRFEDAVGKADWWVHDLRRTAASGMARLGVPPHVIEKVLNHKSGQISGVAAVYNRYGYEKETREALEKWAVWLERVEAGKAIQLSVSYFSQDERTAARVLPRRAARVA
jgi:integrase